MDRSQGRARVTVREPSAAKLPESMRNESGFAGGSSYSASQIRTAWRFMSRGDKDGLRKRDVDLLVRTFRPNITANELEQIVGPIKGRVTYSSLRTILQSSALPQDFDPVLAAFRIFDRDHSSSLSADELVHYVSAMPDIGKLDAEDVHVIMKLVDKDRDGVVSLDDFRAFMADALRQQPGAGLHDAD